VDPETGIIVEKGHPLHGKCITGTVLAFPYGKGSTVGSYVLYALSRNGHAPAAIINAEAEAIIATGAIIAEIPMVDRTDVPIEKLRDGIRVTVNGDSGDVEYDSPVP
jgi:predicted aconitase with swiveling domain